MKVSLQSLLVQTKYLSNGTGQGQCLAGKAIKTLNKDQMGRVLTLQPC